MPGAESNAEFTALEPDGYLRLRQVLRLFPVSHSTWYAGIKSGKYPRAVRLGANTVAWRSRDIKALLERFEEAA